MYLYGGGYVISSPHSRRKLSGHLANASGANALIPQYGLAPEHPFPAAVEDTAVAYRWLLGKGLRPERLIVAGGDEGLLDDSVRFQRAAGIAGVDVMLSM